ncbi:MAG: hypothetical protein NVV82_26835 [Sporocytophaga sp.]|nr:hypothetical protein [Sporocytophaga sp.]
MIKFLFPSVVLLLISCTSDFSAKPPETNSSTVKQQSIMKASIIQDTVYIKKWLTKLITDYVNSDDLNVARENMRKSLTEDYYKLDAITLEYSEMTEEDFIRNRKQSMIPGMLAVVGSLLQLWTTEM